MVSSWLEHLDGLMGDLDAEESSERARQADIRARLEAVQIEAANSQERLEELAATRRTLLRMRGRSIESSTELAADPPDGAEPGTALGGERQPPSRAQLSEVDERVVMLLAGRGQAMRAREVTTAVGVQDTRGRVEVMRSRLKRLTARGWLAEVEQGLFTIAADVESPLGSAEVNGHGGEGAPVMGK